jgi:AcrR family transcriptional regulator
MFSLSERFLFLTLMSRLLPLLELSTMSRLAAPGAAQRRRRADAERNVAAILGAAGRVFGERPDASMDEIARAAGISRQTVYAHFPSRDALLAGLLAEITKRVVDAIDAADLDTGPAADALVRFLEISWHAFEGNPFLLHMTSPPKSPQEELDQHEPVLRPLERLIKRGQRTGEFDPTLPVSWLLSATIGLGHAAGEEVRAGRMTSEQATATLRRSLPRLFLATEPGAN